MSALPARLAVALTDFGNVVVALPVLAVMLGWLWHHRLHAVAAAFGLNATLAIIATILLKQVSRQVGGAFFDRPWHLTTGAPSGHAAVAMVVYGAIGVAFAARGGGVTRILGPSLAAMLVAAVAITRVTLGRHSAADVATGLLLGGLFTALTGAIAWRSPRRWPPMHWLLLALALLAAVMHATGMRFDSTGVL